jgi:hypothetical protein
MADLDDVRRIALALPGASEGRNGEQVGFSVENKGKWKGFAWTWLERVEPKKPRVPRPDVLAVRVVDLDDKEALLASDERALFTEPHYNGFPAVLIRLPEIAVEELAELLTDAWRIQAPAALVREHDEG